MGSYRRMPAWRPQAQGGRMIGKLLCWVGLHDRQDFGMGTLKISLSDWALPFLVGRVLVYRCRRCGMEWGYWLDDD